MNILDQPRYRDNPINLLLENLILDVVGRLPPDADAKLQDMALQRVFKTTAVAWRDVVREVLHLSPTFDTAVLDLWYRNSDRARQEGFDYLPFDFAQEFVDRYFADDSKVDVWTPDTLREAEQRIADLSSPTTGCTRRGATLKNPDADPSFINVRLAGDPECWTDLMRCTPKPSN